MVEIITEKMRCEASLKDSRRSILDSFGYKKILNDRYGPDEYLFFREGDDLVPLVAKEGMATFYGGPQFNHANFLPENPKLLDTMLKYLVEQDYRFRLLSVNNDIFSLLDPAFRKYDVPYQPEWHYKKPEVFQAETFIEQFSVRKIRRSYRYAFIKKREYRFETIPFGQFVNIFPQIMKKHRNYFRQRGLKSAWEGKEELLLSILGYFEKNEQSLIRCIYRDDEPAALYTIVYDQKEMLLYFGGSLETKDHYISKIWYYDMLEHATTIARKLNIESINALRGNYATKRRFGFTPHPLYALVRDPQWHIRRDSEISDEEYCRIYGRDFGAETYPPKPKLLKPKRIWPILSGRLSAQNRN